MYQCTNILVSQNPESPNDTIDYCEIATFDLKGYIPGRLMNMVMASEGIKEFKSMYKHLLQK